PVELEQVAILDLARVPGGADEARNQLDMALEARWREHPEVAVVARRWRWLPGCVGPGVTAQGNGKADGRNCSDDNRSMHGGSYTRCPYRRRTTDRDSRGKQAWQAPRGVLRNSGYGFGLLSIAAVAAFWPSYLSRSFATIDGTTHVHAAVMATW